MAPFALDSPAQVEVVPVTASEFAKLAFATVTSIEPAREALDAAISRYTARNPRSLELHQLATSSMPGGNTRTQLHTSPFPLCMKHGKGYQLTSEDGDV